MLCPALEGNKQKKKEHAQGGMDGLDGLDDKGHPNADLALDHDHGPWTMHAYKKSAYFCGQTDLLDHR